TCTYIYICDLANLENLAFVSTLNHQPNNSATNVAELCTPCGICRQFLIEFGDYKVIIGSTTGKNVLCTSTFSMLPHAFTPASLGKHTDYTDNL
uniref:Cytidine deaminase n=1 Tax=Angiostrongylus cantonensis TaxID=6313 RepID=A0A0K0DIH4_ANGCA